MRPDILQLHEGRRNRTRRLVRRRTFAVQVPADERAEDGRTGLGVIQSAVVSGETRELELRTARIPRWLLTTGATAYGALTTARNTWFDWVAGASQSAGVPVISVGNVTVGGTGKTPLVMELVRELRRAGHSPAVLTRGFGASAERTADEVLEYRDALPETPVVVNADRVRGARTALELGADCVVLDDGFQHRRLRRDFDIVVIDALNPFGGGRLLPSGGLRERLVGLRRASFFVLTRANLVRESDLQKVRAELALRAPKAPVITASVVSTGLSQEYPDSGAAPPRLRVVDPDSEPSPFLPVCAIGNPVSFVRLLDSLGRPRTEPLLFPDHHDYSPSDLSRITLAAQERRASAVVTTRKDWVKLRPLVASSCGELAFCCLNMRLELESAGVMLEVITARIRTAKVTVRTPVGD